MPDINRDNHNHFNASYPTGGHIVLEEGLASEQRNEQHHPPNVTPAHVENWLDENASPSARFYNNNLERRFSRLNQQGGFQPQNNTMLPPGELMPAAGFNGHSPNMHSNAIYRPAQSFDYMHPTGYTRLPSMMTTEESMQSPVREHNDIFPLGHMHVGPAMTMEGVPTHIHAAPAASAGPVRQPDDTKGKGKGKGMGKGNGGSKRSHHIPIVPKGTKFRWEDNGHIDRTACKVGVVDKDKLRFSLNATTGRSYKYKYPHRHGFDWNDKEEILKAKKWRQQILKRRMEKTIVNSDAASSDSIRCKWSEKEKTSIEVRVEDMIEEKGRRLVMEDWAEITRDHNEQFKGVQIHVGEMMPTSRLASGKGIDQRINQTEYLVQPRSAEAVYSQANRWPDVKAMMVKKYSEFEEETSDEYGDMDMELGGHGSQSFLESMVANSGIQDHGIMRNLGGNLNDAEPNTTKEYDEDAMGSPDYGFEYTNTPSGVVATPSPMNSPYYSLHGTVGQLFNTPTPLHSVSTRNKAANETAEATPCPAPGKRRPARFDSDNDADISNL
ncbi:hypothetical protein HYALB_00008780 [Hymenoscyphus albidus]|uniref:Uncharacterized protein n=1 Tax=Hymenoscyphus albidus TaxID=595503 RepID=A0A9N9LY84_9HELO|nr:hypothetical protein HYALB_00008780 [Hymenoscyphus albidus]